MGVGPCWPATKLMNPRGYHIASAPFLAAQSCPGLPLGTVTAGLEVGLQASLKAPPYSFDQGSLPPSPQSLFQGLREGIFQAHQGAPSSSYLVSAP